MLRNKSLKPADTLCQQVFLLPTIFDIGGTHRHIDFIAFKATSRPEYRSK
jgi:hypothetical protein